MSANLLDALFRMIASFLPAVQHALGDGSVLPSPSQIIAILIGL